MTIIIKILIITIISFNINDILGFHLCFLNSLYFCIFLMQFCAFIGVFL